MQKAGKFMLKFLSADCEAPHWLHVIPVLHYSTDHNFIYQGCDHLCESVAYKKFYVSTFENHFEFFVQSYSKQTLA